MVHLSAQMGYAGITELLIDEYGVDPTSKTNVSCLCNYLCSYSFITPI